MTYFLVRLQQRPSWLEHRRGFWEHAEGTGSLRVAGAVDVTTYASVLHALSELGTVKHEIFAEFFCEIIKK